MCLPRRLRARYVPCAAVLVLLPPSEGKAAPSRGAPVDLSALSHPALTKKRERILNTLVRVSGGREATALEALGLSKGQAHELALNRALQTASAAPAAEVYTGVLFERLRLPELPRAARERVLIASALWGVVRPDDRIPAYRLSIGARLPRTPNLAAYWRPELGKALPDDGLVVDLRSGPYAAAWTPKRGERLGVRAFTADGKVISHMVKAIRGDVARLLLGSGEAPETAQEVAEIVSKAGYEVELRAGTLDVVQRPAA
jgi:cytoplasmic iron level regulating protein YaaA (DUF328/UPF0246 family)